MKKVILLNKKEGETPLEALGVFRRQNSKYKDAKKIRMTYAGRLDPMASGLMLVLAGEEVKNKEKYLKLDKEYEFEVLFGFSTDTYDVLGLISNHNTLSWSRNDVTALKIEEEIKENLKHFTGKFLQKYPMYSSKTVLGKQLFEYARAGEEVEAPEREVTVKSLKVGEIKKISSAKLWKNVEKRIGKVKGDFRQKEILSSWRKYLHSSPENYFVADFKIKCSSGTYVRSIANGLGEKMGMPALAFSIKRTKLGKWTKEE